MSDQLDGVALVGMAGRFPDANSIEELWTMLVDGHDGISRFTPTQLSSSIPEALRNNPGYVAARGVIADADRFDAAFFGIPSREALLMDPQQRMLLELSWNALEHANIDPQRYPGSIGVYAGVSNNGYRKLLDAQPDLIQASGEFAAMLGNEKDYVATRIAHRLGLNGPAISIHTACSTSLVAICQAWYALMSWQCDVALAGGFNLVVPQASGYLPVDGGMESGDGTCRPYDAAANGTVFSSGGGMVAMKRLADAQADGDVIFAVLRGVGVNNDGSDKASFTAPSVRGQSAAIRLALDSAGVGAQTIGYVEGHGTGTALGDPIEVAALSRAYRQDTSANQYCWLGSIKGNFGHLVAGSGVAGLIKTALALHHERIPPTLHYRHANPEIDFDNTPFKVSSDAVEWPRGDSPRRAGVSSFGVGGTNAHVIVEEAPIPVESSGGRGVSSLLLSAHDEAALQRRVEDLARALVEFEDGDLPDISYTLNQGRRPFGFRCQITAKTIDEARHALARMQNVGAHAAVNKRPPVVFVFSGQGSQHANMARGLITCEPAFREALEHACEIASPLLGRSLLALIHPPVGEEDEADALLAETANTQPALFVIEYALAMWWKSIGIEADRMIGHSIGEYVAACLAGVFLLRDAMRLVVARALAMQAQPNGAMLAVRVAVRDLRDQLPTDVEIAAINAPELTVLAGPTIAIHAYAKKLDDAGIANSLLRVSHGFHSASMDGAIDVFRRAFEGVRLNVPAQPFYSCVSGKLIGNDEATSPDYWCRQLRHPVHFLDAVRDAAKDNAVFVEVGPGQALTGLIRRTDDLRHRAIPSLGQPGQRDVDAWHLINAVGELACRGVMADSAKFHADQERRLLPLPTYPFHGERYWIETPRHSSPIVTAEPAMPFPGVHPRATAPIRSTHPVQAPPPRRVRLANELTNLFENLSGETIGVERQATSFLEIGLDSLALTQATLELERRYGLKLRFRRLMEDLDTIDALSDLLDDELPADVASTPPLPVQAETTSLTTGQLANPKLFAELIQSQLALLQQQSLLLSNLVGLPPPAALAGMDLQTAVEGTAPVKPADLRAQPFGASARINIDRTSMATPAQQRWIDAFISRYNDQTKRSKAFSQSHRKRMADPRVVTGFNPLWKELVYPIVVERSQGAHLWDIDGNEYIDLLNAFGANFLGYQPDYIVRALKDQLDRGMEIGPQHPLTAEVAELISDMTGMARVAFCNTGSEAVMGAMRIARTVTGRDTIVIFTHSYHGIFDEVIVRGTRQLRSIAAAPGILASAVENVLVLQYGSDEALATIRDRGHELAAVMIEPVQSKNPTLQPIEFVKTLRRLCDDAGCALIFDEVITGFRVAPGGAQEYYGVRADIATYGKVIGGGLPLAVIAGSAPWLDALDGGDWQFGDDSYPEAGVTYFAGTFVRHPLALAAARAVLLHLKQQGPQLQRDISLRTEGLVARLNLRFGELRAPMKAVGFSSLWRILVDDDQPFAGLFWYALRQRGLHVYEQFNGFLTEAHGEREVDEIIERVSDATCTLLDAGLLNRSGDALSDSNGHGSVASGVESARDIFPLGDAQREKWLACQYGDQANAAFNESMLLHLDGKLDGAAIEKAMDIIVARHEAFRLCVLPDGSGQWIDDAARLQLEHVDLSPSDTDDRLEAHCRAQMASPFDLERAPLARVQLIKLDTDRHALLFIGHHLIFDGWSEAVLLDELQRGYNAFAANTEPAFATAESYRTYVESKLRRRSGEEGVAAIDYWKQQLANLPAPLRLPLDRQRDRQQNYQGATVAHDFPDALIAALRMYARGRHVTLYSVLVHAFSRLLAEVSGQGDLVIGIPMAGQAMAGSGSLFGDGARMLPLCLSLDPKSSAEVGLQATHRQLLDAANHQDVSIQNLIREGALAKPGCPLTRIVFNLNPPLSPLCFSDLQTRLRDCPKPSLFWDMFVNLTESQDGLGLDLHYASALFDTSTIQSFLRRYEALLGEIAGAATTLNLETVTSPHEVTAQGVSTVTPEDNPVEARVQPELPFKVTQGSSGLVNASTHGEHRDLLASVVGASRDCITDQDSDVTEAAIPASSSPLSHSIPAMLKPCLEGRAVAIDADTNLPALVAAQAQATPLRIALESGARRLTYAGMIQSIDALAAHLVERGVARGELVGICVPRGVELPIAALGVQRAGAAYVALDPNYPEERLLDIAGQSALQRIVTRGRGDIPPGIARGREVVALDELDLRQPIKIELPVLGGNDLAYVLFTSGSTGHPKGVRILQRNLVNFLSSMQSEPGISEDDALVAVTTLSFDISGLEIYLPLLCGARVVIADENEVTDPVSLAALIRECDISILQTTPTLLRMLLDGAGDGSVAGLKLLVGGEALPRAVADRALAQASELWNMYGPTETTIWSTLQRIRADTSDISLGQPIANTHIYLVDSAGHAVDEGERGEIVIAGAGVADGYLNRDDLTADRFVEDPHRGHGARRYRTGDIGSIRGGRLHYHGRSDQQVKIRGHRIELGEIEATALKLSSVAEALAAIHEYAPGDQRLLLYVSARSKADDPTGPLRQYLREWLPGYMLPQQIIKLDQLPRTSNGKLDRNALPSPATASVVDDVQASTLIRRVPMPASRDARTTWLAALWCDLIGLDAVADEDNFFEIGGHSLLAVEMATKVQKNTGVRINLLMIATGSLVSLAAKLPPMDVAQSRPSAVGRMLGLFGIGKK